jgi:hypothetical protein
VGQTFSQILVVPFIIVGANIALVTRVGSIFLRCMHFHRCAKHKKKLPNTNIYIWRVDLSLPRPLLVRSFPALLITSCLLSCTSFRVSLLSIRLIFFVSYCCFLMLIILNSACSDSFLCFCTYSLLSRIALFARLFLLLLFVSLSFCLLLSIRLASVLLLSLPLLSESTQYHLIVSIVVDTAFKPSLSSSLCVGFFSASAYSLSSLLFSYCLSAFLLSTILLFSPVVRCYFTATSFRRRLSFRFPFALLLSI